MKRTLILLLTIGFLGILDNVSPALEADKIFPDSTKGFFSIQSTTELVDRWDKTQLGILLQRPEMKEFGEDLRRQLGQRISTRFGLSLQDIQLVPSGEVAVGVVAPVGQTPGIVFLFDIKGKIPETRTFLTELEKIFYQRKARKKNVAILGETASEFTFPTARNDLVERKVVYLLTGNHLIISDQLYLVNLISQRIKGERSRPLADQPAYIKVMKRCQEDLRPGDSEPIIRWFIHPLELGEAVRSIANTTLRRPNTDSPFEILAHVGFDAIRGIGGTVDLKAGELEIVHRTNIFAPKPHRESMKMLAFLNSTDVAPPDWMPNHIASGTSVFLNPLEVFDNFGPLFDTMVVKNRGGWNETLRSMKEDPFGLQIDVRNELVRMLGQKIVYFTHYTTPITTESECVLVVVEIQKGKTQDVYNALKKLITDEDIDYESREFNKFPIWQKKEAAKTERPKLDIAGAPDLPGGKKKANQAKQADPFAENRGDQFFPKGAFTIAHDRLIFSSDVKYLEHILARDPSKETPLQKAVDYQTVLREFETSGLGAKPRFIQSFARSADSIRPTYEMIRRGKLPESKSILAQGLNMLLTPPDFEEEVRPKQIDGRKMPDFESIKHYFGPSGLVGVAEFDGWFLKGFSLKQP